MAWTACIDLAARQMKKAAFMAVFLMPFAAEAGEPVAIVPNEVIYPGQAIHRGLVKEVDVTNPNLREDYVSSIEELEGAVARRTLLPGRVIPPSSIRAAYAVRRGEPVQLVFANGGLVISAAGSPLESAAVGDFVRVRNIDTGVTVSGTVMQDGSVRVVTQ